MLAEYLIFQILIYPTALVALIVFVDVGDWFVAKLEKAQKHQAELKSKQR